MRKKIAVLLAAFVVLSAGTLFAQLSSKEGASYFAEGVKAQAEGDMTKADVAYQKALLVDPDNKDLKKFILNNYGVMSFKSGQASKAEDYFNQALAIDREYMPARANLGLIYDLKKDELFVIKYWLDFFKIDLNSLKPKDLIVEKDQAKAPAKKK
jgi:tetratricopeptide (TPR) repeat protein